jgi:large subunit ribosomal protein L17
VADLLLHERIRTTEAKAKETKGMAERIITLGKRGDLAARRLAIASIGHVNIVDKVFKEIAPRYATRPGGYTRIVKLGFRKGDAAPLVQLELVSGPEPAAP